MRKSSAQRQLYCDTASFRATWGALLLRVLRLPSAGYLGDFGFFTTATADVTLQHVARGFRVFGISLKIAKSEVGAAITLLGLQGPPPSPSNDISLAILSPLKATNWDGNIL